MTTTCKLCFAPISTCACVTDEHLAARFAAMRQPPLREFLGTRERIRVRQFPDVVAGEQAEWSALAIEAIGDTPAARAATHLDHQRWVRQQISLLSLLEETRAKFIRARTLARSQRETLEHIHALLVEGDYDDAEAALEGATLEPRVDDVIAGDAEEQVDAALGRERRGAMGEHTPAARAATHLDHQRWVRQQLSLRSPADTDAKAITDTVHERLFPGLARGAAERGFAFVPLEECTGLTARWCPIHGNCTCSRYEDGGHDEHNGNSCPLHAASSAHGEKGSNAG